MDDMKNNILAVLEDIGIETSDIRTKEDVNLMDYIVDSLLFIEFIVTLEEKLEKEIPDEFLDFEKLNSFNGFAAMMEEIE